MSASTVKSCGEKKSALKDVNTPVGATFTKTCMNCENMTLEETQMGDLPICWQYQWAVSEHTVCGDWTQYMFGIQHD